MLASPQQDAARANGEAARAIERAGIAFDEATTALNKSADTAERVSKNEGEAARLNKIAADDLLISTGAQEPSGCCFAARAKEPRYRCGRRSRITHQAWSHRTRWDRAMYHTFTGLRSIQRLLDKGAALQFGISVALACS